MAERKILIIEDDPKYRRTIKRAFREQNDYSFVEAPTVEDAVAKLTEHPDIGVILLDLGLPGGDGKGFLERIKDRASRYRVIILTGKEDRLSAEIAREFEVFNYLPKAAKSYTQSLRFTVGQAFKDIEREDLRKKTDWLLEVQRKINSNQSLSDILNSICDAVLDVMDGHTCHIRVCNLSRGDFALAGLNSSAEEVRSIFEKPKRPGEPFSGIAANDKEKKIYNSLQTDQEFKEFKESILKAGDVSTNVRDYLDQAGSAYIVPISTGLFKDAVDAVFNISTRRAGFFSDEKTQMVDEFVTQAQTAITKHWLQKKREELHDDYRLITKMLDDVSEMVRDYRSLDDVYAVVAMGIRQIVRPEAVSIFRYTEEKNRLCLKKVFELRGKEGDSEEPIEEEYEPGQSLTGWVYENGKTLCLPNSKDDTNPVADGRFDTDRLSRYLEIVPSKRIEHYIGVPIKIGDRTLGVIRALNKKSEYYDDSDVTTDGLCLLERGFSEDCRNVLEIVARHLAVGIANWDLISRLRALNEVGHLISSKMVIGELLEVTIEKSAEVMSAEVCMLFLKNKEGDRIEISQCYGLPEFRTDAFYLVGEGVTGSVAKTGSPRLIKAADDNNGKYDEEIVELLSRKHDTERRIESLMVVPIVAKDKILGAIKVINKLRNHYQYDEHDLSYFQTFASYVGVAIENAGIYDLANKRLADAEKNAALSTVVKAVVHEINNTSGLIPANIQAIRTLLPNSNQQIDEMLDTINEAASQAVEFSRDIMGFSITRMREKQALDINEVIRKALAQVLPDLAKYESTCEVSLELSDPVNPLYCTIYEIPFIQIVRNMVINAYQAMEERGGGKLSITILGDTARNVAKIVFADTGQGIKEEHLAEIFKSDFTTKEAGNGIGLWLVKTHLDHLGARIEVASLWGKGTIFSIEIPMSASSQ